MGIGNGGLTCEEFNKVFFTPGCDNHPDLFGMVQRGIANEKAWDFVGMTQEVNDQLKGLVRSFSPLEFAYTNFLRLEIVKHFRTEIGQ